jgi:hypothetical protein
MPKRRLALVVLAFVLTAPVFSLTALAQTTPDETPTAAAPDDGQGEGSDPDAEDGPDASPSPGPDDAPDGVTGGTEDDDLKLTPTQTEIVIGFLGDRSPKSREVAFELSGPTEDLPSAVVLGDFLSVTGPEVVPAGDAKPTVQPSPEKTIVTLRLTVDPSISAWDAGEFTSSIRISGEGFESMTIPVKLTFRSGSFVLGALAAIATLVIGLRVGYLFKANESLIASGTEAKISLTRPVKSVIEFFRSATLATGFITGVVIVVYGIDTQYLGNDTFGAGGFTDWIALFAWGFAAGFSGKTVSDFTALKTVPSDQRVT